MFDCKAFKDLWNVKGGRGRLIRIDGAGEWQQSKWLIASQMILSVEKLETPEATS